MFRVLKYYLLLLKQKYYPAKKLMFKNYFILNRLILEIAAAIEGYSLVSAFSQEKDKLTLEFRKPDKSLFVEISVNPGFPYIVLKDNFNRAKKNTIDFFEEYLPSPLIKIEIADSDRVIRITFNNFIIYFAIRGKYTNLHLIDKSGKVVSFKSEDNLTGKSFAEEMSGLNFIAKENRLSVLHDKPGLGFDDIRKMFQITGKEIILESKNRFKENERGENKIVLRIIEEIFTENPAVFADTNSGELFLAPQTFSIFPFTEKNIFTNLVEALNYYTGKKYFLDDFSKKKKIIEKHLTRELEKISSKINRLKGILARESKEEEYNKTGNLLLINLHMLRKGMKSVQLEDIYRNNEKITIKLDENSSPKQNTDNYFNKSKSERISREKNKVLLKNAEYEYKRFQSIEETFKNAKTTNELKIIMKDLKIKDQEQKSYKDDIKIKFKHYIIDGKYNVYVGKDSKNNDLLTTKFAKQNDYWFHARSVSGSHVVLRVENTKEPVPKNILKNTASIAAFHSKAKTAGLAPVSFTLKKYVVKKKGMEPGKVALLKEDVLLVNPEIPKNCEYQNEG